MPDIPTIAPTLAAKLSDDAPLETNLALQLEPLLVSARQVAAMCGRSERTWRSWDCAHLVPRGVSIGRSRLWRVDELREWITAGCPRRADWELSKST